MKKNCSYKNDSQGDMQILIETVSTVLFPPSNSCKVM